MGSRESQFIFSPKLAQPVKKKKFFSSAPDRSQNNKKRKIRFIKHNDHNLQYSNNFNLSFDRQFEALITRYVFEYSKEGKKN